MAIATFIIAFLIKNLVVQLFSFMNTNQHLKLVV